MGMAIVSSRLNKEVAARKPAKITIDVRAHERMRKSPTAVQMPRAPSRVIITALTMTNCALLGGWGFVVSMKRDPIESAASSSVKRLPTLATIALPVTPAGLLMRIIYFFIEGLG
jgi:hypothetical protein